MKKDLVLLHGALGDQQQFAQLTPLLSEQFRVHSFDFNGHGASNREDAFSIAHFSEQLLQFFEKHELEQPLVFGYSMGGYVALHSLLQNPNCIEQLLTLGTKFNWTKESAQKEVGMLNPEVIEEKVPKFAKALELRHTAIGWKNNMRLTAQMMLELGDGAAFSLESLSRVDIPVTIALGEKDHMVSEAESKEAAGNLHRGVFKSITEWPHPLEKIAPENLADLINDTF